jgi:hypothetical protein
VSRKLCSGRRAALAHRLLDEAPSGVADAESVLREEPTATRSLALRPRATTLIRADQRDAGLRRGRCRLLQAQPGRQRRRRGSLGLYAAGPPAHAN